MKRPTTTREMLDRVLDILEAPAFWPSATFDKENPGPLWPGRQWITPLNVCASNFTYFAMTAVAITPNRVRLTFEIDGQRSGRIIDLDIGTVADE